jgi:hypothetical protein
MHVNGTFLSGLPVITSTLDIEALSEPDIVRLKAISLFGVRQSNFSLSFLPFLSSFLHSSG